MSLLYGLWVKDWLVQQGEVTSSSKQCNKIFHILKEEVCTSVSRSNTMLMSKAIKRM